MKFASVFQWSGRAISFVSSILQAVVECFSAELTVNGDAGRSLGIIGSTSSAVVLIGMYYAFTAEHDVWKIAGEQVDKWLSKKCEDPTLPVTIQECEHMPLSKDSGYRFFGCKDQCDTRSNMYRCIIMTLIYISVTDSISTANMSYQVTESLFEQMLDLSGYAWLTEATRFWLSLTLAILTGINEITSDISFSVTVYTKFVSWLNTRYPVNAIIDEHDQEYVRDTTRLMPPA